MDRILIKDTSLCYEVHDTQSARGTVFMLNGVMASAGSWMAFVKPLEDLGFRFVLHDFMGQLKSDKPQGPYTFAQHIDHILALADHLGVKGFHVIGTSYGAEVGMALAMAHPHVMQSLSFIDGVSEIDDVMKHFEQSWKTMCDYEDPYDFFWGMAPTIYGSGFLSAQHDFLEKRAVAMRMLDRSYFEG